MSGFRIDITDERRVVVYRLIAEGSSPKPSFFLMVALSTLIAAFGLVMNSTAVVIGAMLVAPLMTPIFGVGLGLLRGNPRLLGFSLRAEVLGVLLTVFSAMLLGWAMPTLQVTPEMLARTQPNLYDLAVALFAGAAGAYAIVDEKISPSLPGVAIATAIVPPLANCGLCLSLGAYGGAWGSFLLFFTNFLSILLVAAGVFTLAGMAGKFQEGKKQVARRFAWVLVGLLAVSSILTMELAKLVHKRKTHDTIVEVLNQELAKFTIGDVRDVQVADQDGVLAVLALIRAPDVPKPRRLEAVEKRLREKLRRDVVLFVRTNLTKEVSASGTQRMVAVQTLDGVRIETDTSDEVIQTQLAEQAVREYLGERLGLRLDALQLAQIGRTTVVLGEMSGFRSLRAEEILELENKIRLALGVEDVGLVILQQPTALISRFGRTRSELTIRRVPTEEEYAARQVIDIAAARWLEEADHDLLGSSLTVLDGKIHVLVEATGAAMMTRPQYEALRAHLALKLGQPVELSVRSVPEVVWTDEGQVPLRDLLSDYGRRTRKEYQAATQRLIDRTR